MVVNDATDAHARVLRSPLSAARQRLPLARTWRRRASLMEGGPADVPAPVTAKL